jgi:hypothetical protein
LANIIQSEDGRFVSKLDENGSDHDALVHTQMMSIRLRSAIFGLRNTEQKEQVLSAKMYSIAFTRSRNSKCSNTIQMHDLSEKVDALINKEEYHLGLPDCSGDRKLRLQILLPNSEASNPIDLACGLDFGMHRHRLLMDIAIDRANEKKANEKVCSTSILFERKKDPGFVFFLRL